MASKRNVKTETPGESAPQLDPSMIPEDAATATLLEEQVEATAASIGNGGALDWSSLNQAAIVQQGHNPAEADAHLPHESDIDPDKLTEPVLTRQGWVLPTNDPRARFGGR